MQSKGKFDFLKQKVLLALLLSISAVAAAGYWSVSSLQEIQQATEALAKPNEKLKRVNRLLKDISQNENYLRIYTLTNQQDYLKIYKNKGEQVTLQMDSLLLFLEPEDATFQQVRSVRKLYEEKNTLLDRLVVMRRQIARQQASQMALERLREFQSDSLEKEEAILARSTFTTTESEYMGLAAAEEITKNEKEGVFGKLKRLFGKPSQDLSAEQKRTMDSLFLPIKTTRTVIDTDTIALFRRDSILMGVENLFYNLQLEEAKSQQLLSKAEIDLINRSLEIKDQVMLILNDIELAEQKNAEKSLFSTRETASTAYYKLIILLAVFFLGSIVFAYIILGDISRSNFYKKQLEQEKLVSEKLAETKQEFIANISHEIRTPISSIVGFTEQLSYTPLRAEQKQYVSNILSSSEVLLSLVNDVLDFSKLEKGMLKLEKAPFDLMRMLHELELMFGSAAEKKGLSLCIDAPDREDFYLQGDSLRIKQVLMNLLSNGLKFTEKGEVKLSIEYKEDSYKEFSFVTFKVSDTGIGIPPEKLEGIFESFSQADASTSRKYGGSGLGLSISQGIVRAYGAKIQVMSQAEKGSVFYFTLKLRNAQAEKKVLILDKNRFEGLKDLKLLIADDDHFNLDLCRSICKRHKIALSAFSDPKKALQTALEESFDILLLDVQMPELNGYQLGQKLSTEGPNIDKPRVAFSANYKSHIENELKEAGFIDILEKPFKEDEFLEMLLKYQNQAGSQKPLVEPEKKATIDNELTYSLNDWERFAGGDQELLSMFIRNFITETTENLLQLQALYEKEDWAEMAQLAHKMSNSFGMLQTGSLYALLVFLEKLESEKLESALIEEKLRMLQDGSAQLIQALEQEAAKLKGKSEMA